ncbi:hypothetical protein GCM10010522_53260 [Kribbella solani]
MRMTYSTALRVCIVRVPDDVCPEQPWRRLLSRAELAYCFGLARAGEHLAARVAAKQAVVAALCWPGPVPWQGIEILRTPRQPPEVRLSGAIERWRQAACLAVPRVSLTHAANHAAALAWLPTTPDKANQ